MVGEARGKGIYPASIPVELKNAAAQIMAAAARLPGKYSAPLKAAAKTVFDLAVKLDELRSHQKN